MKKDQASGCGNFRPFVVSLYIFLLGGTLALAQPAYDVGDWTSYKDFRYARAG